MKNVLLFCPDLSGHRHLYCKHLLQYFQSRKCNAVLAAGGRCSGSRPLAGLCYESYGADLGAELALENNAQFLDTTTLLDKPWGELELAASLAEQVGASDIVHVDADLYRWDFALGLHRKKLQRFSNYLILLNTEYRDVARYHVSGWREFFQLAKRIFHPLEIFQPLRNRGACCVLFPRVTGLVTKRIVKDPSVTGIIHCDPRFIEVFGDKSHYVPEVGVSMWESSNEQEDESLPEFESSIYQSIREHLADRHELTPLFFLGDLESRKGFDTCLDLCAKESNFFLIRVGRTKPSYAATWRGIHAKEQLLREGRILEYDTYVVPALFRALLELSKFSLFTYRDYYRTSASFADSLYLHKPVLGPSVGVIGEIIQEYGVGLTYIADNQNSLIDACRHMLKNVDQYASKVECYSEKLSKDAIFGKWDITFGISSNNQP